MAAKTEAMTVYTAGLIQDIVVVTFPALSVIFTSHSYFGVSKTAYGALFLPFVATAIVAALLEASLRRRFTIKRVYLAGLVADLGSMVLLFTSQFFTHQHAVAYGLLLVAMALNGMGFGLTVAALNILTAYLHPDGVDRSVLVLNAMLGGGNTLAPVFVAIFVGLGFWYGLPVMSAVLLVGLIAVSIRLPLRAGPPATARPAAPGEPAARRPPLPSRFWLFAAFAVLCGIGETMNGNWCQSLMTGHVGASSTVASIALTVFWAMATFGRVLFALILRWFPARRTYHLLPLVLAVAFVLIALLPKGSSALAILAFGLAGIGTSALLPLTISFGQEQLPAVRAFLTGGVMAFYEVGFGIAAFVPGLLQTSGVSLSAMFGYTALVALAMDALSFVVVRKHHTLDHLHPRPPVTPPASSGYPSHGPGPQHQEGGEVSSPGQEKRG